MNQQLQDAIKELAIYDGWEVFEQENCLTMFGKDRLFCAIEGLDYHTSADALLHVWRKVRDELYKSDAFVFMRCAFQFRDIGELILNDNLPEAVIKLAGIIQQLKNK